MTRALIIEDNDNNMELITFILEHNGIQTLRAKSGEAGVTAALDEHPDFVLLDIQLPDIDGYEVLQRIRQAGPTGSMSIIAVTSHVMAGDRERLLQAGCSGYIEKPIDPMTVIDEIKQVLERSR